MNTATWMSQLPDKLWLRQIVMPGSHDAGVYGTAQTIIRKPALVPGSTVKTQYVLCQHSDFGKQAQAGSRFFDCRVFLRKLPKNERASPNDKYENRLGHFPAALEKVPGSKEPTLGGYGGALAAVLTDALEFVLAKNSEFVILRFSHTHHPDECLRQIKAIIASKPTYKGAVYNESGNLSIKTIGNLRGKVIMVFAETFNHHITPGEGILRFRKYKDGLSHIDGLATCGEFAEALDMAKVHQGATKGVEAHLNHPGDPGLGHLHFVYWQQTAGVRGEKDIYKTTTAGRKQGQAWTGGAHANLGDFMAELAQKKQTSGKLPANVISHDFVTAETCEKIIRLNPDCK